MKIRRRKKNKDNKEPTIPLTLLAEDDTLLMTFPENVVDNLRQMITRVARQDDFPARLSVISALREEGVTYISQGLAATLANDLGVSVCVVELNWWTPSTVLNLPAYKGIASVLLEEHALDDAIIHTSWSNLDLIPAGKLSRQDRSIVSRSQILKEIIDELSTRYDHLILDIPAIHTTSDAIPLASLGLASCIVVRQGVTSIEDVRTALDEVDHLPILGVIMNQTIIKTPATIVKLIPQR